MSDDEINIPKLFGEEVKRLRKEQKLSQIDLGVKIGADDRKIRRIESGEIDTSFTTIIRLVKALGFSLDKFIKRIEG